MERKSLVDLVDLAGLPRAAVVVEDRYSQVFKRDRVRPAVVADGLAELQVAWPNVPIVFCETRQLAEEWTYRFLAAAHAGAQTESAAIDRLTAADNAELRTDADDDLMPAGTGLERRLRTCGPGLKPTG